MDTSNRISKHNYYLDIAETVAKRATCMRRKFGAVIVKNDSIVATGYNGSPRGRKNCTDLGFCLRESMNIPRGERYELCRSVHAEANAIISASQEEMFGATLYLAGVNVVTGELEPRIDSCMMCKRLIINSGIETVIFRLPNNEYHITRVKDWIIHDDSLSEKFGY